MSKAGVQAEYHVFLDQLDLNVTGPIVAMVCRKWDINAVSGRYLSTDFVISDARGNTMHCTAKAKTSHTFVTKLKEGNIYTITDFAVIPNTEEYHIMKKSAYIIEFHGGTTVRRSLVKSDGFVRHPFDFIDFDDLQVTYNKYLIDVVGYITNVGRIIQQKSGSRILDFFLTNQRGQSIRVTLWGSLSDVLIDKKTKNAGLYAVVLTAVNAKLYNNKLYLSSSSSTMILDDDEIPALKEFKSEASEIEVGKEIIPFVSGDNSEARDGTLENLLIWARNRKHEGAEDQPALLQALTNIIGTSHTFELKSNTFFEHGTYESFTCWHICEPLPATETASTSTVNAIADAEKLALKILTKDPTLCTPSKISEGKRKQGFANEDSNAEITPSESEVLEDSDDEEPATKKKKKRNIVSDSESG